MSPNGGTASFYPPEPDPIRQMEEQDEQAMLREHLAPPQDPWAEQMQAEFEQIEQDLQHEGIDGADKLLIWGYTRSLARRQDEIQRTNEYCERTVSRLEREMDSIRSWKSHVVEAAVARSIQGRKKKSMDTPGGRVGFRARTEATLIVPPGMTPALIDWAKTKCPDAVVPNAQTFRLVNTPLVKFIEAGGKCPLAHTKPAGDDFYYKPAKEKSNG